MKLLLANSAGRELWGGGEKWFVEAALWFREHGHDVTLVCRPESILFERAQETRVSILLSDFGGDFDPFALLRARKTLRELRPDVVFTNFNKESWQFGLAGKLAKVPVVARHGFTLWTEKAHHKYLAERVLSRVIVNAPSICDAYQELGIVPRKLDVVLNGVREAKQSHGKLRRFLSLSSSTLLLASAGRLESQKRFDRMLRILAGLKGERSVTLVIFGRGPLEKELEKLTAELKLTERVRFLGFDPQFASLIGDADLFLMTSDEEGSPNAVLEAMAAGVPVLGFDVGAVKEVMGAELSRFVVESGNEEAFAERLNEILSDTTELIKIRETFRERALNGLSFDQSMKRYEEILNETAAQK